MAPSWSTKAAPTFHFPMFPLFLASCRSSLPAVPRHSLVSRCSCHSLHLELRSTPGSIKAKPLISRHGVQSTLRIQHIVAPARYKARVARLFICRLHLPPYIRPYGELSRAFPAALGRRVQWPTTSLAPSLPAVPMLLTPSRQLVDCLLFSFLPSPLLQISFPWLKLCPSPSPS